ncbi:hypothetical protein BWQ96_10567 [Gracilariopsis chorda]|uniref:Uncharacterized protein n=1 Tax=Gracilariopsis chorda TaxID=448386 RepID=A0A2V3ICB4_9FLOR|nr:hypothetical protein BWQ96_10567 [Gracilariopsis chorda]|eukprot:PXF39729.1 hypothetical protein BWQ96_10567 [Gracilariopsis chorda]
MHLAYWSYLVESNADILRGNSYGRGKYCGVSCCRRAGALRRWGAAKKPGPLRVINKRKPIGKRKGDDPESVQRGCTNDDGEQHRRTIQRDSDDAYADDDKPVVLQVEGRGTVLRGVIEYYDPGRRLHWFVEGILFVEGESQ